MNTQQLYRAKGEKRDFLCQAGRDGLSEIVSNKGIGFAILLPSLKSGNHISNIYKAALKSNFSTNNFKLPSDFYLTAAVHQDPTGHLAHYFPEGAHYWVVGSSSSSSLVMTYLTRSLHIKKIFFHFSFFFVLGGFFRNNYDVLLQVMPVNRNRNRTAFVLQ